MAPPATVDLETCANVPSSGADANGDCYFCCSDEGFPYQGFFDEACACAMPANQTGSSLCASQATGNACSSCCIGQGFSSMRFDSSLPGACECLLHRDPDICSAALADSTPGGACAVCCINAGYIGFGLDGTCVCSE